MNGWDTTIAAYLAVIAGVVAVELRGRRPGSSTPTFSKVVTEIAATTPGRIGLIALWWWVGWHFLARSSIPPVAG